MFRASIIYLSLCAWVGLFYIPTGSAAQIKAPHLNYRERAPGNGLKVYSLQDKSSPTVSVQVWYKVGAKNDPEGRSGLRPCSNT